MSFLADQGARGGTLIAAAMETAGAKLQSDMLDLVNGAGGQTLAGLLFLIAILGAVAVFAFGGNYKWGRYLLIGPPLFFFLTQVRIASDGAEWQFAERQHSREAVDQVLVGVANFEGGERGGFDVAMFFQFWNILVTDTVQYLIGNLSLEQSDSDLNFLAKVERYMNHWLNTNIHNPETRSFVKLALVNECADYYLLLKDLADPDVSQPIKERKSAQFRKRVNEKVFTVTPVESQDENETMWWLQQNGVQPGSYTCQQVWDHAVRILRNTEGREKIEAELGINLAEDEDEESVFDWFYKTAGKLFFRASGQVVFDENAAVTRAVDEYIARALFREVLAHNRYSAYLGMEGHSGVVHRTRREGEHGEGDVVAQTSSSIQQFNQTEKYQFKGDFVNAALSMPYFQGVIILLLSAAYPFFAMAVVMPGRAGAMFLWMSLWVWVKSWDLGFAVVMMIDNLLYGMFPRAPGLEPGEVSNAGLAWVKILEVDPTYSANTYYNLIAACLFAVPVVTGFLVQRGGSQLVGMTSNSWQSYSTQLSGSAANFFRSLQAQTYMRAASEHVSKKGRQAMWASLNSEPVRFHSQAYAATYGKEARDKIGERLIRQGAGVKKDDPNFAKLVNANLAAEREAHLMAIKAHVTANVSAATYNASTDEFASDMARRGAETKFYSHDLATSHPGGAMFAAYLSDHFLNREQIMNSRVGAMTDIAKEAPDFARGLRNKLFGGPSR